MHTVELVRAVSDSGSSGLVDDMGNLKAGYRSGILRGLVLNVVEVRWDGDDRVHNLSAKVRSAVGVLVLVLNLHNRNFQASC